MRKTFMFRVTNKEGMFNVEKAISERSVHRVMRNLMRKHNASEIENLTTAAILCGVSR